MTAPPVKKKTVSELVEVYLLTTAVACDVVEFLLLLADGVVVLMPIVFVASFVIAMLDMISNAMTFLFCGLFSGKNAQTTSLTFLAMCAASFIPVVENLPSRTAGMIRIIMKARQADKKEYEDALEKYKKEVKDKDGEARAERAKLAAQNAMAQRPNHTVSTSQRLAA